MLLHHHNPSPPNSYPHSYPTQHWGAGSLYGHGSPVPLPSPHRSATTAGVPAAGLHHYNHHYQQQQHHLQLRPVIVQNMSDHTQQQPYVSPSQDHIPQEDESHKDMSPLMSDRISTSFITTEYAKSDPVYQAKTAALPQKFHQYRTTRRDGHCGWRAVAFCYFETLQSLGSVNKCNEELARIQSLRNLIITIGHEPHIFEGFEEETLDLLNRVRDAPPQESGAILQEAWNDYGISMSIITHMKLLTSAWIRTHPDDFQPYLQQSLEEYCSANVEAADCEVDNISLNALAEVLLKPAGFTLKVMYLDRSPGPEINEHRFDALGPDFNPIPNAPTITLLYRPGHYDILYRIEEVQRQPIPLPVSTQSNVYIGLASTTDDYVPQSRNVPDVYAMLPGILPPNFVPPQWAPSPFDFAGSSPVSPLPPQQMAPLTAYAAPPTTPVTPSMPQQPHIHGLPMAPMSESPHSRHSRLQMTGHGPFRPSRFAFEALLGAGVPHETPCTTSVFQNSPHNTSHFLNPHFQPEEWDPSILYQTPNNRGRNRF